MPSTTCRSTIILLVVLVWPEELWIRSYDYRNWAKDDKHYQGIDYVLFAEHPVAGIRWIVHTIVAQQDARNAPNSTTTTPQSALANVVTWGSLSTVCLWRQLNNAL